MAVTENEKSVKIKRKRKNEPKREIFEKKEDSERRRNRLKSMQL